MDDKMKFQQQLADLKQYADEKNGELTLSEIEHFLQEMDLNQEQMDLVSAYLLSKGIHVEGASVPQKEAQPYTEEEEEFLRQYRKELKQTRRQSQERLAVLWQEVAAGQAEARELLAEHYMEMVLQMAEEYAHQGMLIQDLIQEGSLGLLMGIAAFSGETDPESHLKKEIRQAIHHAMEEQNGEISVGTEVTGKLNRLADSITELTEDLGRQITPDELSIYLEMPLEEIEDLLRIAGDTIEMADAGEKKE